MRLANVILQPGLRRQVDDRSHIRIQAGGVPGYPFIHVVCQEFQHPRRDLILQTEYAQGGAALSRTVECGLCHVLHDLFRQR